MGYFLQNLSALRKWDSEVTIGVTAKLKQFVKNSSLLICRNKMLKI